MYICRKQGGMCLADKRGLPDNVYIMNKEEKGS